MNVLKVLLEQEEGYGDISEWSCNGSDTDGYTANPFDLISPVQKTDLQILYGGWNFYAYATPIIIILGVLGNGISLRVFTTRRMRKMSASWYLAALAMSDGLVLLIYVLIGWLFQGLPRWPGHMMINILIYPGVCESYLYFSYIFRFCSAWLIVIFTIERYIGVCKPLYRRALCTESFAKRALFGILLSGVLISLYKPILCGVEETAVAKVCTRKNGYELLNFSMDAAYGCSITIVPFAIIICLNLLIVRTLRQSQKRQLDLKMKQGDDSGFRMEFTIALLVISSSFILVNLPYFLLWCYNFRENLDKTLSLGNLNLTHSERIRGWLFITKTIFFCNYCMNFFLYSLTGGYFRRQLKDLFSCKTCIKDKNSAYRAITYSPAQTGSVLLSRTTAVSVTNILSVTLNTKM